MPILNDGRLGNWLCYVLGDASKGICVQKNQHGPEHRSGRIATRGFNTPEEAFSYLSHELGLSPDNIRFYVSSPEQFFLTVCVGGSQLPLTEDCIIKGLRPAPPVFY